jgi:hypothetical protein
VEQVESFKFLGVHINKLSCVSKMMVQQQKTMHVFNSTYMYILPQLP